VKALSGRQPWWWAILHGGKRVENRRWNTAYRGPILLHAAKGCTEDEYHDAFIWMTQRFGLDFGNRIPELEDMPRGGIVGRARIVDVIPPGGIADAFLMPEARGADRRWHMEEQYGFVLADVEPLSFVPCKGSLGLWSPFGLADLLSRPSGEGRAP
jgi:hypothetical protein